jgi:hypothetical protein
MTPIRILIAIAFFAITSSVSAATVSGEITTQSIAQKPKTTIANPVKKIVIRTTTKTVRYTSPAGKEWITFTVKHKNGVIVSATAKPKAKNKISRTLQENFAKNISKSVVGKNIKDLDIDTVG